jgi:hypothetical protein
VAVATKAEMVAVLTEVEEAATTEVVAVEATTKVVMATAVAADLIKAVQVAVEANIRHYIIEYTLTKNPAIAGFFVKVYLYVYICAFLFIIFFINPLSIQSFLSIYFKKAHNQPPNQSTSTKIVWFHLNIAKLCMLFQIIKLCS